MTRRIKAPPRLHVPKIITSANIKGGVGKTTAILVALDLLELHGYNTVVVQLDTQDRLRKTIGRDVIALDTDTLRSSRSDPSAGLKVFRPLMQVFERAAQSDEIILFDVGASLVAHFLTFASLSQLDDDLRELRLPGIVLVPSVAEPEAIHQAALTIKAFHNVLPGIESVFVENRRDGALSDLVSRSEAEQIYQTELQPVLKGLNRVTMPAVAGRSWALFERHFCRPLHVISMEIPQIMALTELPRAEAKIARGDVAAWVAAIEEEFAPILGLGGAQ